MFQLLPIQALLITLLLGMVAVYFRRIQSRLYDRIIILAFLAAGVTMVMLPDSTTHVANWLRVGRGADLVLYLGLLGLAFAAMLSYVRQRELGIRLTELTRSIAIQQAIAPSESHTGKTLAR